jgi:hypothetical protein
MKTAALQEQDAPGTVQVLCDHEGVPLALSEQEE